MSEHAARTCHRRRLFEQRPPRINPDLCDAAGMEQIVGIAAAGGLQAYAGKAQIDDLGEAVPVGDEESEEADLQGLLDEPRDHVVTFAPGGEEQDRKSTRLNSSH